jgi:hypothetical protein
MKYFSEFVCRLLAGVILAAPLAGHLSPAEAIVPGKVTTPPPVSGRSLFDPDRIQPADVLARVELLRANVDLLRRYMGKVEPPVPLLQGTHARPDEVYSQALNLEIRANRLAFEQVRVVRRESSFDRGQTRSADVFTVVDSALASVLLVKQDLNIKTAIGEKIQPESTTPTEVFNAVVVAGSEINNLLRDMTSPSDVFQLVTAATHIAATLHATLPGGAYLPEEPDFEPGKMPVDVLMRIRRCYEMVSALAHAKNLRTLRLAPLANGHTTVTPNDVSDMASLLVEELKSIHMKFPGARPAARAYYPGKRFPAHVFQRVGLLEAVLQALVDAYSNDTVSAGG